MACWRSWLTAVYTLYTPFFFQISNQNVQSIALLCFWAYIVKLDCRFSHREGTDHYCPQHLYLVHHLLRVSNSVLEDALGVHCLVGHYFKHLCVLHYASPSHTKIKPL